MARGLIRLCYKKTIDATCSDRWAKLVFDATHKEFFMQAQQFDQQKKYTTFSEIIANVPQAEAMHYLVSTAAAGYMQQLNGIVPDVRNAFDKTFLLFRNFRFEILQSHIRDKNQHKVVIYFYSEVLTWLHGFDRFLIVAPGDQTGALEKGDEVQTETIALSASLSIRSYQEIRQARHFPFIETSGNEILN